MSLVACPAVPYVSTLSHKRHDFRGGKKLLNIKHYVLWDSLQLSSEPFPILRRIRPDIVNLHSYSGKVPVILIRLYWNMNFRFKKNFQKYQILLKFVQWEPTCSTRRDGQKDRHDEKICAFLGYYAAYSGNSLPMFRNKLLVPSSGVKNPRRSRLQEFLDFWPLKMGNVGKELPLHAP